MPGDDVKLLVHTTAAKFSITVYRDGKERIVVYSKENISGKQQITPENAFEEGCNWQDVENIKTGKDWLSGVYVIILKTQDDDGEFHGT